MMEEVNILHIILCEYIYKSNMTKVHDKLTKFEQVAKELEAENTIQSLILSGFMCACMTMYAEKTSYIINSYSLQTLGTLK